MGVFMEINNINNLNSIDNTNKSKLEAYNKLDKYNQINKENTNNNLNDAQSAYKLSISGSSSQKSKESSYYNSLNQDTSEGAQIINETYMNEIVKNAQKTSKPDNVDMDDVSWGLLVKLGEDIGLTDPDKLAQLTVKDIEAYFYNKNIIERGQNLLKDSLTANEYVDLKNQKFNAEDYWDRVFDENGNKKDYNIYTINQTNTGLPISKNEFFSDNGNVKLTDLSAASLQNILIANENKNTALFTYATKNVTVAGKEKTIAENQQEMIKSYNAMQEYAATTMSEYEQLQIIKSALKSSSLSAYLI